MPSIKRCLHCTCPSRRHNTNKVDASIDRSLPRPTSLGLRHSAPPLHSRAPIALRTSQTMARASDTKALERNALATHTIPWRITCFHSKLGTLQAEPFPSLSLPRGGYLRRNVTAFRALPFEKLATNWTGHGNRSMWKLKAYLTQGSSACAPGAHLPNDATTLAPRRRSPPTKRAGRRSGRPRPPRRETRPCGTRPRKRRRWETRTCPCPRTCDHRETSPETAPHRARTCAPVVTL